jgi:hypothetical protein
MPDKTRQFDSVELEEEKKILNRMRRSKTWIDSAILDDSEDLWAKIPVDGKPTVVIYE